MVTLEEGVGLSIFQEQQSTTSRCVPCCSTLTWMQGLRYGFLTDRTWQTNTSSLEFLVKVQVNMHPCAFPTTTIQRYGPNLGWLFSHIPYLIPLQLIQWWCVVPGCQQPMSVLRCQASQYFSGRRAPGPWLTTQPSPSTIWQAGARFPLGRGITTCNETDTTTQTNSTIS